MKKCIIVGIIIFVVIIIGVSICFIFQQDNQKENNNLSNQENSIRNDVENSTKNNNIETNNFSNQNFENENNLSGENEKMKIKVKDSNNNIIVFELNNSSLATSLYSQLPLTIDVQNYSDDEKIFYPPTKLDTQDCINANAKEGTLAYFSPWGDVVMYYKDFGTYSGLYEIGNAVEGKNNIKNLSGTITVEKD